MKHIIICIIASAYFFAGCNNNTPKDVDHEHQQNEVDTDHEHEDEIIFTEEKAQAAGIVISEIQPKTFRNVIKTSGQVLAAQGDDMTIAATSSGIVAFGKASLTEGSAVNKGTILLSISAQNIQDGDPAEKTEITYRTAQKEYERAAILYRDKIISEKEYNQALSSYETARVAWKATAGHQGDNGIAIASPMNGFIKSKLVNDGDYVEIGQPLLNISQNRRLMLKAEVSERYYQFLPTLTSAHFKTPYNDKVYTLESLNGKLKSYGRSSGNGSFYLPVIFEFDNKGDIIPGSYVEVFLLSGNMNNVITVPVTALTEEQGSYFVYLQLDKEGYKKQEVTLGVNDGEEVQILSGIKPGDRVVTKGAYQVKLAANSSIIPEGHSHSH
ncbi:efflux RND transporter periplasmic adaptor subunit [Coprobacter fastidiosus]|mgnify:FL=1|jgi:cobalt-zinc-cadmium efflux system membrane fusion protein|uniref:efflux RND transporter periplasmic adaptor subunit n=1 Tax=Coprobacter fastidiosus TaxID=1099853 RepID=UPI00241C23CD|nr:efflux RND transporter periplasmic adaptor subunit [Coprobacter fastidiosus]